MHLLILWNATAGGRRAHKYLQQVEQTLSNQNIKYQLHVTEYSGHARTVVAEANLSTYDGVVAAGGDGTVFEVVNGLMQHDAEQRKPLGIIPLGTGNAFIKDLGIEPYDWQHSLQHILSGQQRSVDVAQVSNGDNTFFFLNIIGLGFVVKVGQSASKLKYLGKSAYTLATLWHTMKLNTHRMRLTVDGEVLDENLVFIEVANSRYTGSSFLIAPDAKIDDGKLDIIMLREISRGRLLRLFPTIYDGSHTQYPEIMTQQAQSVRIETENNMALMPDGEFHGFSPIEIQCLPKALSVFNLTS